MEFRIFARKEKYTFHKSFRKECLAGASSDAASGTVNVVCNSWQEYQNVDLRAIDNKSVLSNINGPHKQYVRIGMGPIYIFLILDFQEYVLCIKRWRCAPQR